MSISLRIKELRKENKVSQKEFASSIGIDDSQLSKIERGILQPTINQIMEISSVYKTSTDWLLTGNGEIIKRASIIKSYPKPDKQERLLPLIPIEAIAGFGAGEFTIMEHDVLEYYKVPEFSNADFLIPVKGSSMQPKYYGGDILACKHIQSFSFFQWGVPHVITIKNRGTVVKRIKKTEKGNEFDLVSDNEKYDTFTITINDIVNIAIVIGVIRVEN